MEQVTTQPQRVVTGRTVMAFGVRVIEAMVALSVASLLAFTFISPLSCSQKVSACLFSSSLPFLIMARALANHLGNRRLMEGDQHPLLALVFSVTGRILSLSGFILLLWGLYVPAAIFFFIGCFVVLVAFYVKVVK